MSSIFDLKGPCEVGARWAGAMVDGGGGDVAGRDESSSESYLRELGTTASGPSGGPSLVSPRFVSRYSRDEMEKVVAGRCETALSKYSWTRREGVLIDTRQLVSEGNTYSRSSSIVKQLCLAASHT